MDYRLTSRQKAMLQAAREGELSAEGQCAWRLGGAHIGDGEYVSLRGLFNGRDYHTLGSLERRGLIKAEGEDLVATDLGAEALRRCGQNSDTIDHGHTDSAD